MERLLCILSGMNAGGAETFLMKIYCGLDRTKYQMDFCINVKEKCFYEDEIEKLGGKVFRIPSKSEDIRRFKKELTSLIQRENYKRVLRITSNAMGFLDLMIAKKAGAEICIARSSNSSDGAGWKVKIAHMLGLLFLQKYVDVKIAPSELAAEYTFGKCAVENKQVNILHNGVNLDFYKYDSNGRKAIREEFGIDTEQKVVGHIGRFSIQKNHLFLLDVFKELSAKENVLLLLVGTGELEEQINLRVKELGIEKKVIFAGVRQDIPQILSAMDIFVFPSLYEGMPNTVIEAQATGLPCVIADTITKEANISGKVTYLSLEFDKAIWINEIVKRLNSTRECGQEELILAGYDIQEVVMRFVNLSFDR